MTARYEAALTQGLPYLVAELAGAVRGYALAGLYSTRPGYRFTVEEATHRTVVKLRVAPEVSADAAFKPPLRAPPARE